jgi:hypothetical protein
MARAAYLSASQAAEIAKVDRRTIVNWCREKRFDSSMVANVWIINERSFMAFLWGRLACK